MPGPMSGGIVDQANGPLGTQGPPAPPQTQSVQLPAQVDPNTSPAQRALGGAYNAPNAPNAPQPQVHPLVASAAKTGLGWHALMGSHGEVGPNGTVVQAPNKPGDLFRSILAGAIMGASTGAQARMGGGVGSFAVGAGAAQQQAQQEKEKLQQQSQQSQQKLLMQAQIENMNSETAARHHTTDLQNKEYHDKHNAASQAMIDGLTAAGGVAPVDGKIAETVTVPDLVKAYTKDPTIRQAPSGYMRHFIDTTDSSEVTFNGDHWVKADGTPENMTDNSTIKVIDVPANAMSTKRPLSGKDLNKISGQTMFDPEKTYQVAPIDMDAMNTTRLKNENEKARTDQAERQIKVGQRANELEADRQRHAEFDAQRAPIAAKKESLQAQLKALDNDLAATPADKQALKDQIAEQDQSLQDLADQEYPKTGKGKTTTVPAPKSDPKVLAALQGIPGVNPAAAAKVAAMKPEEIKAFLVTANIPADKKAAVYAALGETPPPAPPVAPRGPYTMQSLGNDITNAGRSILGQAPAGASTGAPLP